MVNGEALKKIPKIDRVMEWDSVNSLIDEYSYEAVLLAVREAVNGLRTRLLSGEDEDPESLYEDVKRRLAISNRHSLVRIINGTGVVLHTNLGRAAMPESAVENVSQVMGSFSNLEYDIEKGSRGSRHDHLESILKKLTGASAAMVVNNNAAATMLCLGAMANGKQVIVSRSELVEIGGSFRVPEIIQLSGGRLVEVGTTNKCKLRDYEAEINEDTAMILKVHQSNFSIVGFTEDASLEELVELGKKHDIPVVYDMGNGLLKNLDEFGIREPDVHRVLETGVDILLFSGDKLLGGPQAGIILGGEKYIELMKRNPFARAVRIDKLTIAAMEATLSEYLRGEDVFDRLPVLNMITMGMEQLRTKADGMLKILTSRCGDVYEFEIVESEGKIGGGTAPLTVLESLAISIECEGKSANEIEEGLRMNEVPVVGIIRNGKYAIDVRTVFVEDSHEISNALLAI